MKLSFKVSDYYKNNHLISKFQGIALMCLGFIILIFIILGLYFVATKMDLSNGWSSEDSYSNSNIDCSDYPSQSSLTDNAIKEFSSAKLDYENLKSDYYNTSNIDKQVDLMNEWVDKTSLLIDSFNNIIEIYNNNPSFYDRCYTPSLSNEIESMRSYINREESIQETEFNKLRPRAEAEGYVFTSTPEVNNPQFPFSN